jgi:hypothetical protein
MTFRLVLLSLAAVLVMSASTTLTFSSGTGVGSIGTVSYSGGSAPLVGSGIAISELDVLGAPMNNGTYFVNGSIACSNPDGSGTCGSMDFTSGPGGQAGSLPGVINLFAGGGSITIKGTLVGVPQGSTTLATGDFSSAIASNSQTLGFGLDTKDTTMLAFFGITNPNFNFAHITLDMGSVNPTNSFSQTVNKASFENTETPEPRWIGSLLLVGLMAGLFATRRFRAQQS